LSEIQPDRNPGFARSLKKERVEALRAEQANIMPDLPGREPTMTPPVNLDRRAIRNAMTRPTIGDEPAAWFLPYKTSAEIMIALTLLIVTFPLILLIMIMVKITSPGPAIFKQVRLGRGGKPYNLYKIRSMTHDCERLSGPQWSTLRDSRVTPFGRFLRRSHLDELPQLWNVVRKEMSLVGPRPERPEFVTKLELEIPGYRTRMEVLPGITGLSQIQLPPDETVEDVKRKVACDLCYVGQMSPGLDLKIYVGTTLKLMGFSFAMTRQMLNLPGVPNLVKERSVVIAPEPTQITQWQST
jgi:lipopolysaccharide/colanic/teichoic acid biosynthesis glycosyltransferase